MLEPRVDALQWRLDGFVIGEAVDAHHDAVAAFDLALDAEGSFLDVALLVAALDRRDGATEPRDLVEVGLRGGL